MDEGLQQATTTTTKAAAPAPRARSPIRCPHCRAVDPQIKYGELAYYTQTFIPVVEDGEYGEDWAGDGELGETDGSSTIDARCDQCDGDLTTYLIGWSQRNPDHAPYAGFIHEVHVPRGLPKRRNARSVYSATGKGGYRVSDEELQRAIAVCVRELGELLDEREERARLKGSMAEAIIQVACFGKVIYG